MGYLITITLEVVFDDEIIINEKVSDLIYK